MSEELFSYTQLFQQAIETTITCRSIIKYNSTLSNEQKAEILADIDNTLTFLEARLAANATIESSVALSPEKLVGLLATEEAEEDEESLEERLPEHELKQQELSLQHLYRLYHTYLSNAPGKGIADLETRYRTVMGILDQLQEIAGQRHDVASGDVTTEHQLHRVRGFVTAVYCMFREFAVLLSNIVEGKNIDMDTEGLSLLPNYSFEETKQQMLRDITPLMQVYGAHLQLQEQKGTLTNGARDAAAFLIFLEECLEQTFTRRHDVISQLHAIASLLDELTRLLAQYEQAMANIIVA